MEGFAYALVDKKTTTVYVVENTKAWAFAQKHGIPYVSDIVHLDDLEFPDGDYDEDSSHSFADTIGSLLD